MNIKKILVNGAVSTLMFGSLAVPVFASTEHFDFGQRFNGATCDASGNPVINVTLKVIKDADSGFGGAWAFDNFNKRIQVWNQGKNSYCAVVRYQGQFVTLDGVSPSGVGAIGVGVKGTFEGGYVSTTFTGTLNTSLQAKGSIGLQDYQCDTSFNCPGAVNWVTQYFPDAEGFDLADWGWIYHAGNNGTWVNALSGSTGDITGN